MIPTMGANFGDLNNDGFPDFYLGTGAPSYGLLVPNRMFLNQIGRVRFLQRDYAAAVEELQQVLAIDPEDLMAHYTLMLAYRGVGDMEQSEHHQKLSLRFKADEASQILTGEYKQRNPEDNNESQAIHEHASVDLDALPPETAGASAPVAAGGAP